jgi:hypothetical protein
MKLMRRLWVGATMLIASLTLVPAASADETMWRSFRGRVMFSDIALAPEASFASPEMMASALRRIQRTDVEQAAGFWRLHVLAFLDRPAATGALVLRASDVTDPRAPRQVRVFEVPIQRGEKELRLDDFVVNEAMGFARGASYQITIEAARDEEGAAGTGNGTAKAGKADVYAKGVITLR